MLNKRPPLRPLLSPSLSPSGVLAVRLLAERLLSMPRARFRLMT